MKVYGDKTTPGYIPEITEAQVRISKPPKSDADKNARIVETGDGLELTGRKVPVKNTMREAKIGSYSSVEVEFDVREVPMMKQKLKFINESILNYPAEALSAQANLNSETVASLIV